MNGTINSSGWTSMKRVNGIRKITARFCSALSFVVFGTMTVTADEMLDLSEHPAETIAILQYYHGQSYTCVDIQVDSTRDMRSGSQRRAHAEAFCNPEGNSMRGMLLASTRACGATTFGRSNAAYQFMEILNEQDRVLRFSEIGGEIFARLAILRGHDEPNELFVNAQRTLCGKFDDVEYDIRLRDLDKIGNGYFRVEYSVSQYSGNYAVSGVLFHSWNPTLTRTLIFDENNSSWRVEN